MESFGRIAAILAAVMLLFPFICARLSALKADTKGAETENRIALIYENIKNAGEITATDLLSLKEAASLCSGTLKVVAGCRVQSGTDETSYYREYMYLTEIEQIIRDEGSLPLLKGDSLSISVAYTSGNGISTMFSLLKNAGRVAYGGII